MGVKQFEVPEVQIPANLDIAAKIPSLTSNFVLGKRMESFFELVIHLSNDYQFLAGNLQISEGKITLGELDFLIKDLLQKNILHIEMVYKFYVYDPSITNEIQRWIGPNRRDSLLQKMDKLKKKQLPLLFKSPTKTALSALNIAAEDLQQLVCFKANLFIPRKCKAEQLKIINQDCVAGFYIHRTEFSAEEFSGYGFFSPKKQDWPIEPKHNTTWLSYSEILAEVSGLLEQQRSPLIWMRKDEQTFERFFLVWW